MGPFWGFRGAARPKSSQAAQKGPDARRRAPRPPRRTPCTLRGAAALANEADGPFSAAGHLGGAVTASRRLDWDGHEAERTRSCRHGSGSGWEEPGDLPDEKEDGEGDNDEVHDRLQEGAIVQRGGARRLGRGDCRILRARQTDEEAGHIALAQEHAYGRHEDIAHEGRDDLAEGRAYHHGDGELDHIAPHDELFELSQHVALLSPGQRASLDYSRDNATLVYSALASGLRPSARTAALSLSEGEGFIFIPRPRRGRGQGEGEGRAMPFLNTPHGAYFAREVPPPDDELV